MYYVITDIFRDKMTRVYQGTLEDCINYVDEDTDIYFIIDENNEIIETIKKEYKMTVRDLINELLRFDVDEEIQFFDEKEKILTIKDIGIDPNLPYIQFKKKGQ